MLPTEWAEAGAAPNNNIIGEDPGLRDPEGGDFHADRAAGYGCRVLADRPVTVAPVVPERRAPRAITRDRLDVGGVIDHDTVWDAAEVRVVAPVEVIGGADLAIAAGAAVRFTDFHGLTVLDGSLQALGTADEPIVFTSERPDEWMPDDDTRGAWDGLAFVNVPAACDSSRLRWCVVECAKALPDAPSASRGSSGLGGAVVAGTGGALDVVGASQLVVDRCIFRHNLAQRGAAVAVHFGASPLIVNSLFHDNLARQRGAGLYASYSDPVLIHNTFVMNETTNPSSFTRTACIDHVHSRAVHVGGIYWANGTSYYEQIQIREPRAHDTRYCDIENWLGGEGCLSVDPLLDVLGDPRFGLMSGSPAVDAGDATAADPWLPATDLAGHARVAGAAPDLGAYEWTTATPVLDPLPRAVPRLAVAPNPFNPRTVIAWTQDRDESVRLVVHDAAGRLVTTLFEGRTAPGPQRRTWDGRGGEGTPCAAGVYLVTLVAARGTRTVKVVLAP